MEKERNTEDVYGEDRNYDVIVVGGGPAGMAAAVQAHEDGVERILIAERNSVLGGILPQCIHDGFGLAEFGDLMTGPEYASAWIKMTEDAGIDYLTDAAVISLRRRDRSSGEMSGGFVLEISSLRYGMEKYYCRSVILATGCRERTRGQLRIPGSRPAGVYTAGAVQYMMNVQNYLPGKTAVILGSGDIGLIIARRMKWEGIHVKMILGERASGLLRNYIQCVKDWEIPIRFSHTVTKVHGRKRLTGVTVAPVQADGTPDEAAAEYIRCDLLVIAAGLIPETEVWKQLYLAEGRKPQPIQSSDEIQTQEDGVFICGNIARQYDAVDEVSASGRNAGKRAADYLTATNCKNIEANDFPGQNRTVTENTMDQNHAMTDEDLAYLSSPPVSQDAKERVVYCICCPRGCRMTVNTECGMTIAGNSCDAGKNYALQEIEDPRRMVTTTVGIQGCPQRLLPARTSEPVRKRDVKQILNVCAKLRVSLPKEAGDVLMRDVAGPGSGIDLISCGTLPASSDMPAFVNRKKSAHMPESAGNRSADSRKIKK